jgi:hypothetical protein
VTSNLSPSLALTATTDPRFQPGAYITNGDDLYYVQRAAVTPMSLREHALIVEDCRTNTVLELEFGRVGSTCTLVRRAPT